MDEFGDHFVEFDRVSVQVQVEVAELVEDELLPLSVFEEEERY